MTEVDLENSKPQMGCYTFYLKAMQNQKPELGSAKTRGRNTKLGDRREKSGAGAT